LNLKISWVHCGEYLRAEIKQFNHILEFGPTYLLPCKNQVSNLINFTESLARTFHFSDEFVTANNRKTGKSSATAQIISEKLFQT
jgi:hypothetical protein